MDTPQITTPDEVREWRTSEGFSQGTLADRLGVSVRTVRNWEKGVHAVPKWLALAALGMKKEAR